MNYFDIAEAKKIYKQGKNITQYLRNKFNVSENTSEIIEIAYDLQAGSYIEYYKKNPQKLDKFADEFWSIMKQYIRSGDSILDAGAGELTMLSLAINRFDIKLSNLLALDISWSRLQKGLQFYLANNKKKNNKVEIFVADIKEIPLHEKCIDIVTSVHSLEANGKNLPILIKELFRIAKRKLLLFEPSYELNSKAGKDRMNNLGYIKDIEGTVERLGGKIIDIIPIINNLNPLNPTACYIIEPPTNSIISPHKPVFCVPGTNFILKKTGSFLGSKDTGLLFPILDGIPILRSKSALLATTKF